MCGLSEEFNHPSRVALLTDLKQALNNADVSSTVWACLWLSDTDKLSEIIEKAKNDPELTISQLEGVRDTAMLVEQWTRRKRSYWIGKRSIPEQLLPCWQRDQGICILQKAGDITEVAHIYPPYIGKRVGEDSHTQFWQALRQFWSEERVKKWEETILSNNNNNNNNSSNEGDVNFCSNLLSLGSNAHAYFNRALFAFKPLELSEDKTSLTLQFFWLHPYKEIGKIDISYHPYLPGNLDAGNCGKIKLFDCEEERLISSGEVISLHTDDPVERPLPSFELLEMQWVLHRVAALSGIVDCSKDEEEDEEIDQFYADVFPLETGYYEDGNDDDGYYV